MNSSKKKGDDTDARHEQALLVAEMIHPFLANLDPGAQGAVLAELCSTWLASFEPGRQRQIAYDKTLEAIDALTEIYSRENWGDRSN